MPRVLRSGFRHCLRAPGPDFQPDAIDNCGFAEQLDRVSVGA
jgi:hypothetical protein